MERDELLGSTFTDALDDEGISAAVLADDEALKLTPDHSPRVVITSMNRGHSEDLSGLDVVSAMRRNCPGLCAIYSPLVAGAPASPGVVDRGAVPLETGWPGRDDPHSAGAA